MVSLPRSVPGRLALLFLGVSGVGVAFAVPAIVRRDDPVPWGLRLGMGPHDVRLRLARTLPGDLRVVPAAELALEWHGASPDVRALRLELHEGKLVALRARVAMSSEIASGDPLWQSRSAVLSRRPRSDGDVDVVLVARDCPTHRDEVARLLRDSGRRTPPAASPPH